MVAIMCDEGEKAVGVAQAPFGISVSVSVHLLFNLFGPFGFTWSIGKIVISDPPPAIPCMCKVSIISASGRPTIP